MCLFKIGVTRQRLEGFDRPITLEPEFYADKKDALIAEFRNYLGILKAVHSGADLQASATAAGNRYYRPPPLLQATGMCVAMLEP
jgi:hypothetical protein